MFLKLLVLVFEVLYYSIFMYYAKREGKFYKYLLLFIFATFIIGCTGTNNLLTYILFVLLAINGLKMFTEPKLYDMFVLTMMLIFKIIIEYVIVLFFYNILGMYATIFLFEFIKIILLLLTSKKINKLYVKFDKVWYKNNFYIRYIFSCLVVIYIIFSALALLNY